MCVDWVTDDDEGDKLLFLFDGDELDRWAWVASSELADHLRARLARRVSTMLQRAPGSAFYLEHGITPPA